MYNWFKIFNTDEFDALGLVSKNYEVTLDGVGLKNVLVTKGIGYGMTCDDVFVAVEMNGTNPTEFDGLASYIATNGDVYLGFEVADEN